MPNNLDRNISDALEPGASDQMLDRVRQGTCDAAVDTEPATNIAIVGDVHGHLTLMYAVLGRWQKESGRRIDLILQCGDMGAFLQDSQLDRATKRWSQGDPEELGFGEFAGDNPPRTLLDPRPPVVFIPGNHEDFLMLDEREKTARRDQAVYSVSNDGKIQALRSGRVWSFGGNGQEIRIAGISGIARASQKKGRHPRYYLSEDDAMRLAEAGPRSFDILISHWRKWGKPRAA